MPTPKKADFPSQKAEKFIVRMPEGMRETIRKKAEENRRSMTAEIIARLEQSLEFARRYPNVDALRHGGVVDAHKVGEEKGAGYGEANLERELLELFRGLTSEEKRALLLLLKR